MQTFKIHIHMFLGYWFGGMGLLLHSKPILDVLLVLFGILNLLVSMFFLIRKNLKK